MNLAASSRIPREPLRREGFHAIRIRHAVLDPIGTAHTIDLPSRYSPGSAARIKQYEALYLADHPVSALQEVEALVVLSDGTVVHNWKDGWCVIPCTYSLSQIVDLTVEANRDLIETTITELTGQWRSPYAKGEAPTQLLGEELFQQKDVEGIVYPAAKTPLGSEVRTNLVIFPERLATTSRIRCVDAFGKTRQIP